MKSIINKKSVQDFEVKEWLLNAIPELSEKQKDSIRVGDVTDVCPFEIYKSRKKIKSIWFRLTIIIYFPLFLLLLIFLPINFLITGYWGYQKKYWNWFFKWYEKLGL